MDFFDRQERAQKQTRLLIWLFGLAELSLALTLNTGLAITMFALGFVAHFIATPLVGKNARM